MIQRQLRDTCDADGGNFDIESSEVFVASANSTCRVCRRPIEVVCLYCHSGRSDDEWLGAFRIQCLWAVDAALGGQLQRWPTYRWSAREGKYLNHCAHCGAAQDEELLHEEPEQPFFELTREAPEGVRLQALPGRVRLSGDYVVDV